MTILPESIRDNFKHFKFGHNGKCTEQGYDDIVSQYSFGMDGIDHFYSARMFFFNINNFSCLNGWTFGNIIASAHDLAMFFYELLGNKSILKAETLAIMENFEQQSKEA